MKTTTRILSALLAALMLLCTVGCGEQDETVPDGMKLASSDIVDYRLYVPENWTTELSSGAISAYYSKDDPSSVSVMTWNLTETTTVASWWEGYQEDFKLVYQNFELLATEDTKLGDVDARKYTYTGELGPQKYKFVQTAAIRGGMIYLFTYTSTAEKSDSHIADVGRMLAEFRFS